jgi:hypothetical protein
VPPFFVKKVENLYMYEKKVGKIFGQFKNYTYLCIVIGKQAVKRSPDSPPEWIVPLGNLNNKINMGTRSCVIIKVRPEDIGKMFKFDEKKLPEGVKLDEWLEKDSDGKVWLDEVGEERSKRVKFQSLYIGIYCHWDGYPSGVGAVLKEKFLDYHSALNLVIGGACSALDSAYVRHYANRQGEKWEYLKPTQGKTQREVLKPFGWSEYAYLFDEARGGWVYKPLTQNYDKNGFKPLSVK